MQPLTDWHKASEDEPWSAEQVKLLADVALATPTPAAAEFLTHQLRVLSDNAQRLPAFIEHAARHTPEDQVRKDLIGFIENQGARDLRGIIPLILAYQQGLLKRGEKLDKLALAYADRIVEYALLFSRDETDVQSGIELAGSLKLVRFANSIERIAEKDRPDAVRLAAVTALTALDAGKAVPVLARFLNDGSDKLAIREKAAQALGGLNRADANDQLVKAFAAAPARLQTAMAVAMVNNALGAEALLSAVETGKASARLLQDKVVQTRLNDRKLPKGAERVAALTKGLPSADANLLKLLTGRRDGFTRAKLDIAQGKLVFIKNCAICHQIGNEGTKIGPQLDGIGGRGLERLLEDVLDPNRNVDAAFRTTIVTLTDGKRISGLSLREEGEILVMADDKGKEIRIAKKDIDEKRLSPLSPMPANVAEIIPEKDFHDLMAYLLTQRATEKKD